jgi:NitT/TauT family transport system substrate-binding protein
MMVSRESLTYVTQLPGLSFGIGRVGSLDHTLTQKVLEQLGVQPDSVSYVPVGQPAARLQALASNQGIDATTITVGTWASLPDKTGLRILVDLDLYQALAPVLTTVNVVSRETLDNRRDDIEAFIRALINVSRDISADPSIWVDGMVTLRPDVPRSDLEIIGDALAWSWCVNGGLDESELEFTVDWYYQQPNFYDVPRVELTQWVDFSIVESILFDLGIIQVPNSCNTPACANCKCPSCCK